MSALQDLNIHQITQSISTAAQKQVPATITIRIEDTWVNYHSRLLAVHHDKLVAELPLPDLSAPPHEFVPGERIGVAFKLKHYKHIFCATVAGMCDTAVGESSIRALSLCLPTRVQRLQRRVFQRAEIPDGRVVRASVWLGGAEDEPKTVTPENPVWVGQVLNLSAGGFQMVCTPEATMQLDVGDSVGVRLVFGAGDEAIYADAQFRHFETCEEKAIMGFQFVGLGQSPRTRETLKQISIKVSNLQQSRPQGAGQK